MEKKQKSIHFYMRTLHRDVGFLMIGLVVVFALSGIVLVYRDTDFLKKEALVQRTISPNLAPTDLGAALKLKNLKVEKEEDGVVFFNGGGNYDQATGMVSYTTKEVIFPFDKFISLHKMASQKGAIHWLTVVFGVLMLFLAISSFWMFKGGTLYFRRGLFLAGVGVVIAVIVLFIA